jgi:hypothetical protein
MEFTEEQIQEILKRYKKSLEYSRERYKNIRKNDPEYQRKNRERAKKHYDSHKEEKKQYYENNREELNMKQRYRYYKNKNQVEVYKNKFPENYKKLVEIGFIN